MTEKKINAPYDNPFGIWHVTTEGTARAVRRVTLVSMRAISTKLLWHLPINASTPCILSQSTSILSI